MEKGWSAIVNKYGIANHDFDRGPFPITAEQIKSATSHLATTSEREVRILCKMDTREKRPTIFQKMGLFLLPTSNGKYCILKGEGYVDIPPIQDGSEVYRSQLGFSLDTSQVGDSEMQHLDYAYATSMIRTFLNDDTLVLTVRGRKYTPSFTFRVGKQQVTVQSVQTEVDAGYEGKEQVVLVEAKNSGDNNVIIRQLFYPLKQWTQFTKKPIQTLLFAKAKHGSDYLIWHFQFTDPNDYNSIKLVRSKRFTIIDK